MTKPEAENTAEALVDAAGIGGSKSAEPPVHPAAPPSPTNAKTENIHVSPAVLEAARKNGEEPPRDTANIAGGRTQAEGEDGLGKSTRAEGRLLAPTPSLGPLPHCTPAGTTRLARCNPRALPAVAPRQERGGALPNRLRLGS